jgi:PAS domain S-box-containing protein
VLEESGAGEFDEHGLLLRVRGLAADVTERRHIQAERRQLTELLAQTSEPIFVWELDGVITYWNAGAEALYGYTAAEAIGHAAHGLLQTVHPIPWPEIRDTLEREGQWLGELVHHTRDGRDVMVESRKKLAVIDGQQLVMESNRDITERKRLERMQREFVALAAHELKTPLTSLKGFAQLLQRGVQTRSALETIVNQVNRLDRLVSDLLDISRLDTGRLELRRGTVNLVTLMQQILSEAQASTNRHRLRLDAPSDPVIGEWDEDRLTQSFQNLLSNAIKYSPDGGPIEVTIRPRDHQVVVSIRDHGLGVSAEDLPRIFQRFQRLDAAKDAAGGLGLGLSITHALIAAHGGRVWAESPGEGQGTTFQVALPTVNDRAA